MRTRPTTPNVSIAVHRPKIQAIPELGAIERMHSRTARKFDRHIHPGKMEICYIHRGVFNWAAGEKTFMLSGGDIYITWPDEEHGGVNDIMSPGILYWLVIDLPPTCPDGYFALPEDEAEYLHNALNNMKQRSFRSGADLAPCYDRVLTALDSRDDDVGITAIRTALLQLLTSVLFESRTPHRNVSMSGNVRGAIELMDKNLEVPLTVPQLAESTGWSVSHFKMTFRKETGVSPAQFYLGRRVSAAVERICCSDDSLAMIAADLGFSSSQYLATCVRRLTGRTPSSYRQEGPQTVFLS